MQKGLSDGTGDRGTKPVTTGGITFNGFVDDAHETFSLPAKANQMSDFEFCKTAQKPYDVVVVASLARLSEVAGITVSSDGSAEDWEHGVKLASKVLGRPVANPLKPIDKKSAPSPRSKAPLKLVKSSLNFRKKTEAKYYLIIATATPWGRSQSVRKVLPGLTWYDTEGHGGLCVSHGLANKKLSPNARAEAIKYAGSYWYEEDVQWTIPMYENPEWLEAMKKLGIFSSIPTKDEMKKRIEQSFPHYLTLKDAGISFSETVKFRDLQPGDLLYIDKIDSEPFSVKSISGDKAIITRHGSDYRFSKNSYFSRIKKAERDGKILTKD